LGRRAGLDTVGVVDVWAVMSTRGTLGRAGRVTVGLAPCGPWWPLLLGRNKCECLDDQFVTVRGRRGRFG
jgi:hypothetical protein